MATTPTPTEDTTPHEQSSEAPKPHTVPVAASPSVSTSGKWVLTSIAAVGLLGLGLLGGMQIGQQMVPVGAHASGPVIIHQGGQGQVERIPDGMKERMQDRMKERMQERRDQLSVPEAPDQNNG